ncbi:hypothetical protein [Nocardioides pacificus]
MESEQDIAAQLRDVERAAAAPYVVYPPTPRWYPPAAGTWAAALVGVIAWGRDSAWFAVGMVTLLVAELAFLRWYSRRHGALPSLRQPPPEFRSAFRRYAVGVAVVLALVALAWTLLGPWAAVATTWVAVTVGLAAYERLYAQAARRVRERLG